MTDLSVRLRPVAERLITKAKRGDLHARRQVLSVVRDKDVVFALFDQIAPADSMPFRYARCGELLFDVLESLLESVSKELFKLLAGVGTTK